jgi:hypothetical protein
LLSLALEIHFYTDSCVSWPIVFNLAIDQAGAHTTSIKNKDGNSDKFSNCSGFDGWFKAFLNSQRKIPLE